MSKYVNHYTDDFKLMVISEVLSGSISKEAARKKYSIRANSAILNWIRKFDAMEKPINKSVASNFVSSVEQDEISYLKKALEMERLKSEAYSEMISIAEKEFNIPIRKKSGAKQS